LHEGEFIFPLFYPKKHKIMQDKKDENPENQYVQDDEISQQIDEERVVQTHSNLGLVDARPGESTFETGTKNHSTQLDHAFDEVPESLWDAVALEDHLSDIVRITKDNTNAEVPKENKRLRNRKLAHR